MPRLDLGLTADAQAAVLLAKAGEKVRATCAVGSAPWSEWPVPRLEALYELAYLRVFISWEVFLESTFCRYLCGYESVAHGKAVMAGGVPYHSTIRNAELAVLSGSAYLLWHNPSVVVNRCRNHVTLGRHEVVVSSNLARLRDFAAIRHRVAHGQEDARRKFDNATLSLAGRTYLASRPGRFLRDWVPGSSPKVRWLESIVVELGNLAGQIV